MVKIIKKLKKVRKCSKIQEKRSGILKNTQYCNENV